MRIFWLMLIVFSTFFVGCRNMYNRRVERREAFEDIRPKEENRILPDKPIKLNPIAIAADKAEEKAEIKAAQAKAEEQKTKAEAKEQEIDNIKIAPAVRFDESLAIYGLKGTVCKQEGQKLSVYMMAQEPVEATLVARGFNIKNEEFNRVSVTVKFSSQEAKYVHFDFPAEGNLDLAKAFQIEKGK